MVSGADWLKQEHKAAERRAERLEVWACNWPAYEVYRCCQLTFAGMGGTCMGLSALEISAAMDLNAVRAKDRPALVDDLRIMAAAATQWLNDRSDRHTPNND